MKTTHWIKYILAFVITAFIFVTAIVANNFFNTKRIEQVRSIEEGISIDILSLETQFQLLQEQSCENISENPVLSNTLYTIARKLSFTEARLGADNPEVIRLKQKYSLLEIKDFLLMKKVANKCSLKPIFILYFYSNEPGTCNDCTRQGYVLTELAKKYPQLRTYSFDYNIDLAAVKTLIALQKVTKELPALVINDKLYSGFMSTEKIQSIIPELNKSATSTATSTEEI